MFGRLSDTFGRRTPLLFSLLAFGVGTAWCGAAGSIMQFILARAVCGLGAGGAGSLSSIVVGDMVPLHRRGSYLAIMNLAYGTGTSLGAALGGFLAEALGWRWEFGIQIPIIAFCFIVVALTVPPGLGPYLCAKSNKGIWHTILGFDLAGSLLLSASVTFLVLALNLGGNVLDWNDPLIIACFILFGVLTVLLVAVERRAEKPVMPMHLLAEIPRGNLVFGNFLFCMTLNTILFNVPLYFQATLLDSPTRSGLRLILPFVLNMIGAFITGNLINHTKRLKPTLITGSIFLLLGSVFLTSMTRGLPSWSYSVFIGAATLGQGFAFPTINISILAVTHTDDMAVATSTLILFRSLGTVMGVAVSSLVSQNALVYFLKRKVVGPESQTIIEDVRKSVEAIVRLTPVYKEQGEYEMSSMVCFSLTLRSCVVIEAYAAALKATFAQGIVTAVLGLLLVMWIRLPRLSARNTDVEGK
jgi:MFS family permease